MKEQIEALEKKIQVFSQELEALKLSAKEEEFKVGDWVKLISNGGCYNRHRIGDVIKITGIEEHKIHDEILSGGYGYLSKSDLRKATTSEIETHLISEAEKKGFVKGAKVNHEGSVYTIEELNYVTELGNSKCVDNYIKVNGGC
jgi:hypothetical protein